MVFLLIFFLPYTIALLFGNEEKKNFPQQEEQLRKVNAENEMCLVKVIKSYGTEEIPLEEYLVGNVAATIPGEYLQETIKAQTVIMRSGVYEKIFAQKEADQEDGRYRIREEELGSSYLNLWERKKVWGEEFEEYEEKFEQAVRETEGLVIKSRQKVINPPFFRLSNGNTRDSDALSYIVSVPCEKDIAAKEQLETKTITVAYFLKILEKNQISVEKIEKIQLIYDDEDYVKQLKMGDITIDGEKFREMFQLSSPSFTITKNKGNLTIKTRGIGHGFGLSQYMANCMATQENDFLTILHYFYQNIDIEKIV